MKKILILSLSTIVAIVSSRAQNLLIEDFNYQPGQLTNASGGANVSSGAWISEAGASNYIQVIQGNLTYPGYITNPSQNSALIQLTNKIGPGEDAYASFDSVKENSLYASFLLEVNNTSFLGSHLQTDSANFFAGLLPGNGSKAYTGRVHIRKGVLENTYNLGVSSQSYKNSPITWSAIDYPIRVTCLVTIGYTVVPGPLNDVAKLWVNPPNTPTEPKADAESVYSTGSESKVGLARFALHQDFNKDIGSSPECEIDAIKISQDWYNATLPLTLRSFNVVNKNKYAGLNWETNKETNLKNFEIQKSKDAINFSAIASIAAKNSASLTNNYNYNDREILTGTAYYRLKITDNSGAFSYSAIVSVNDKAITTINLFPNPVVNSLTVSHPKSISGAYIQVMSFGGNTLLFNSVRQEVVQTSVDVSKLPKGNYILVFSNGQIRQTLNFVKQ